MEEYSTPSVYYKDVEINVVDPLSDLTTEMVLSILEECDHDDHIRNWYLKWWSHKDLWYCCVATIDGKPIALAGASEDGKVLRYLYTLKDYRIKYRGIPQMDFMRVFVDKSKTDSLYIGIHAFTKKHEKLAKSYDRQMLSGVPRDLQPWAGKWKYEGIRVYRDSDQHIWRLDI